MKKLLPPLLIFLNIFLLQSCSGPNPNPGERTADVSWHQGNYKKALEILQQSSQKGFPWAQLRLGVAYQLGLGVEKDFTKSLEFYKKVAKQKGDGGWANGMIIGALGKSGYFNQNGDAMVAQYQIATIYLKSDKRHEDLTKAYLWINYVAQVSKGENIFYCCEFAGGRWITQSMIKKTMEEILQKITNQQKQKADNIISSWVGSNYSMNNLD